MRKADENTTCPKAHSEKPVLFSRDSSLHRHFCDAVEKGTQAWEESKLPEPPPAPAMSRVLNSISSRVKWFPERHPLPPTRPAGQQTAVGRAAGPAVSPETGEEPSLGQGRERAAPLLRGHGRGEGGLAAGELGRVARGAGDALEQARDPSPARVSGRAHHLHPRGAVTWTRGTREKKSHYFTVSS